VGEEALDLAGGGGVVGGCHGGEGCGDWGANSRCRGGGAGLWFRLMGSPYHNISRLESHMGSAQYY
jgi:hypothetical protein